MPPDVPPPGFVLGSTAKLSKPLPSPKSPSVPPGVGRCPPGIVVLQRPQQAQAQAVIAQAKAVTLFSQFDADGDGRLSCVEMYEYAKATGCLPDDASHWPNKVVKLGQLRTTSLEQLEEFDDLVSAGRR